MNRPAATSAASMVLLAAASAGCATVEDGVGNRESPAPAISSRVTPLRGGLDALVDRFNEDVGKPRIVALLSPT